VNVFKVIGGVATAILLAFSGWAIAGHGPGTYKFAFVFLLPFLWGVYAFRGPLQLLPVHYALFASALIFHGLGVFGFYTRYFFGLHFDSYVHFYFGIAGGSLLARALEKNFNLRGVTLWAGVILIILGIGAIHEMIEAGSTMLLGPEKGMLKLKDPNPYDTQKDLMNNMLGAMLAVILYYPTKRALKES
jgi:uncharacterized membrane protein YjdF